MPLTLEKLFSVKDLSVHTHQMQGSTFFKFPPSSKKNPPKISGYPRVSN